MGREPENKATDAQSKPFGAVFKVLQSSQPNLQVPFPLSDFFWNCSICKKQKQKTWEFCSLVLPLCALANPTQHSRHQPVSFLMRNLSQCPSLPSHIWDPLHTLYSTAELNTCPCSLTRAGALSVLLVVLPKCLGQWWAGTRCSVNIC